MAVRKYILDLFSLDNYKSSEHEVIEAIKKSVEFRGVNVWVLAFAIFIASIGLNMNSTAVIIGAMLISPLMGPIMGVGLGVGIYDFELIKKSLTNMAIMMMVSIGSSTLYFLLSPLQDATPEITARTIPSIWDVLIATFGGFAGIVATATKEKGNVIPGVAIATALMPPLCTAGFGLATGNWYYFGGALYLFFINAVFVSLATLFMVRFLRFQKKEFVNQAGETKVKRYITIIVLITALPSIYIAYNIVKDTVANNNIKRFVENEFSFPNTKIVSKTVTKDSLGNDVIEVFLIGERINNQTIESINSQRDFYGISSFKLEVKQGIKETKNVDVSEIKTDILEELYAKNEETLRNKQEQIEFLEKELLKLSSSTLPINEISKEFCALNNNVKFFTVQPTLIYDNTKNSLDTVMVSFVQYKKQPSKKEKDILYNWLKIRTQADSLLVITQK